jgi:hypothetical protein
LIKEKIMATAKKSSSNKSCSSEKGRTGQESGSS